MHFVYDDTARIPKDIRDMVGQRRFGDLMDAGEPLVLRMRGAAEASGMTFIHLRSAEDTVEATHDIQTGDMNGPLVVWPARLAPPSHATASLILERCHFLQSGTRLGIPNSPAQIEIWDAQPWATNTKGEEALTRFHQVSLQDPLFDLSNAYACIQFLSGAFKTRHFNDISRQGNTIVKRSLDVAKMQAEHDFFYLLPREFQRFFVQPYDFIPRHTDGRASYEMERLSIPDMSVLWTHHAFSRDEFSGFLDRAFDFIARRPRKAVSSAEASSAYERAHTEKLTRRAASLRSWTQFEAFDALLRTRIPGGYDALIARWHQARTHIARPAYGHLAIGHGDFCLSNILYDKRAGLFKLIDPKGAITAEQLWVDPGYDLAKLSHSVLGGYDFVVKGIAPTQVQDSLSPYLLRQDQRLKPQQTDFLSRLQALGLDWRAVRLDEACLFLSMLPLHIDVPGRVLALALLALDLLQAIEAKTPLGS